MSLLTRLASRTALKGVAKGFPVGRLLLAGDVALLAGRHLGRLSSAERRRFASLVRDSARRSGGLSPEERKELDTLVAKVQPRLLLGLAIRRLSPVPIPRRVLYGRRNSPTRRAAREQS
jgi:hypothetical protein